MYGAIEGNGFVEVSNDKYFSWSSEEKHRYNEDPERELSLCPTRTICGVTDEGHGKGVDVMHFYISFNRLDSNMGINVPMSAMPELISYLQKQYDKYIENGKNI